MAPFLDWGPDFRADSLCRLLDHFHSYYGGLICVCWSPDGKYVLTGGQDDLISIWHVPEATLIARCQGHHSWVTSVAFDPWRCDDKNYRFGSVGADRRLCLWDFSVGMLHRPRGGAGAGGASVRQRGSIASRFTASQLTRAETQGTAATRMRSDSANSGDGKEGFTGPHPVEPRANTAILPPVLTKVVDADPLCWLEFTQEAIMTSCKSGMFIILESRAIYLAFLFSFWISPLTSNSKGTFEPGAVHQTRRLKSVRSQLVEHSLDSVMTLINTLDTFVH